MSKKNINTNNDAERQEFFREANRILQAIVEARFENAIEEEMDADDRVILILYPEEPMLVTSYMHRNDSFKHFDFDEGNWEDEFGFCMAYDSDCVVTLGENDYLVEAPLMITSIDENGNERSISLEGTLLAMDFLRERETIIEVDGEAYPAFRLNY